MLNYYKANYPREPYRADENLPLVKRPVLMIHGLDDKSFLPGTLTAPRPQQRDCHGCVSAHAGRDNAVLQVVGNEHTMAFGPVRSRPSTRRSARTGMPIHQPTDGRGGRESHAVGRNS
jgi:hypothetical protein